MQIWILPNAEGQPPRYDQKRSIRSRLRGRLRLVASGSGADGSIAIRQDVNVYASRLEPGQTATLTLPEGRHLWDAGPSGRRRRQRPRSLRRRRPRRLRTRPASGSPPDPPRPSFSPSTSPDGSGERHEGRARARRPRPSPCCDKLGAMTAPASERPLPESESPRRWRALVLIASAELLAMSLWFSGSAVAPALRAEWGLLGLRRRLAHARRPARFRRRNARVSALGNLPDVLSAGGCSPRRPFSARPPTRPSPTPRAGPASGIALRFADRVLPRRRLSARHEDHGELVPAGTRAWRSASSSAASRSARRFRTSSTRWAAPTGASTCSPFRASPWSEGWSFSSSSRDGPVRGAGRPDSTRGRSRRSSGTGACAWPTSATSATCGSSTRCGRGSPSSCARASPPEGRRAGARRGDRPSS